MIFCPQACALCWALQCSSRLAATSPARREVARAADVPAAFCQVSWGCRQPPRHSCRSDIRYTSPKSF